MTEQNTIIRKFLKNNPNPSKEALFILYYEYFLHPDIETEFTQKVAHNAIEVSYTYFSELSPSKKFHFLVALGHLFDSALTLKIWEFQLSRNDASWFWRDSTPAFLLTLTGMIEPLENLRREMGIVQKRNLYEKVICVEGESELNFIKTIFLSTKLANFDFPVYDYHGKGNAQNLAYFIKEKNRQGIRVLLSYDKDRRSDSFVKKVKEKSSIEKVFRFEKDFESSFPPKLLKYALESYIQKYTKLSITIDIADIRQFIIENGSFLRLFEKKYGVKINKVKFSKILGIIVAGIVYDHFTDLLKKKKYEIYSFLRFLIS
jgi:hypothetical protein